MSVNLIIGSPASGKTTALVDIALSEVKKKKKVLFITNDSSEIDILKSFNATTKRYLAICEINKPFNKKDIVTILSGRKKKPDILLIDMISTSTFIEAKNMKQVYTFLDRVCGKEILVYATYQAVNEWSN